MILTKEIHGNKGNPHSQYDEIIFKTKHPTIYNNGWNLVADNYYKYDISGNYPMKTSLRFLLYANELDNTNNMEEVEISINATKNNLECIINITPLIGNRNDSVRCISVPEDGGYRVKIYTQNVGYSRNRIIPIMLDTISWLNTIEYRFANKNLSFYDRVVDYFRICGTTQDKEQLPNNTIQNDNIIKNKSVKISTAELDVKNTAIITVATDNGAYLNNFVNGKIGQTICLSCTNSSTQLTITNNGNIRTKSGENIALANNTNTLFVNVGGLWFQI